MRLTRVSASALLILVTACSSNGDDTPTEGENTETNTGATSGPSTASSNTNDSAAQSVAPNSEPTSTSPNSTVNTTTNNTNATTSGATSDEQDESDDNDASDTTDGESSSVDPDDQSNTDDSDTSAPDTSDDATETDTTDAPNETSDTTDGSDVVDTGADDKFSFFVTSYHHLVELSGSEDGFGGDLRYNGAATGLEGADAICQEIARRVGFGSKTWRAYLSTSSVNAIDRIGEGPWYDFVGALVAQSPSDLTAGGNRQPGGCCETGTYDELGLFHDGTTDENNDGMDDDDHDTMTATLEDGTYAGFSCEDWTSTTATSGGDEGEQGGGQGGGFGGGGGPGGGGGIQMGHTWPARSGEHWATSHAGHQCAAGTNFVQNGGGDSSTVGGGGGYGGFYCFATAE